jgi:hypothetical protein
MINHHHCGLRVDNQPRLCPLMMSLRDSLSIASSLARVRKLFCPEGVSGPSDRWLVFLVDGLQGPEATAASKCLASKLSKKWGRSHSEVVGHVRSRISAPLVKKRQAARTLLSRAPPFSFSPRIPPAGPYRPSIRPTLTFHPLCATLAISS